MADIAALPEVHQNEVQRGLWADTWRQIRRNRFALVGFVLLAAMILMAVCAPWVAPADPNKIALTGGLKPPSAEHLLGTDELGRDVLSRVIYGARISLTVGLIVVGIAGTLGVLLGAIAGFYGGLVDNLIMRLVDILMAFPFLILALAVVAIVGPSLTNMMIVLGGVVWIEYARVVRGMVLSLKNQEFVLAAKVLGGTDRRVILRHILPNCLGVIIVQATFGVAEAILSASALSYLGMGAQPPTAEWGSMLNTAKPYLRKLPLMSIAPGMAIMLTVLSINFIGDALRDAFDPRSSRSGKS